MDPSSCIHCPPHPRPSPPTPRFLWDHILLLSAGTLVVMLLKSVLVGCVVRFFIGGGGWRLAAAVGISMAHIGEFSFVLLSMANQLKIISSQVGGSRGWGGRESHRTAGRGESVSLSLCCDLLVGWGLPCCACRCSLHPAIASHNLPCPALPAPASLPLPACLPARRCTCFFSA